MALFSTHKNEQKKSLVIRRIQSLILAHHLHHLQALSSCYILLNLWKFVLMVLRSVVSMWDDPHPFLVYYLSPLLIEFLINVMPFQWRPTCVLLNMAWKVIVFGALATLSLVVEASIYNKPACYSNPEKDLQAAGVRYVKVPSVFNTIIIIVILYSVSQCHYLLVSKCINCWVDRKKFANVELQSPLVTE